MCFSIIANKEHGAWKGTTMYKVVHVDRAGTHYRIRDSDGKNFKRYKDGAVVKAEKNDSRSKFVTEIGADSERGIYVMKKLSAAKEVVDLSTGKAGDSAYIVIELSVDPEDFLAAGLDNFMYGPLTDVGTYKKVTVVGQVYPKLPK